MIRSISYKVAAGALSLAVLAAGASDAFAGWRWHGSSGGSSGSSGGSSGWSSSGGSSGWSSSGGSSGWSSSGGSSGSSGGSSGWFHRHHHKRWHGSSGSSGGSSGSSGGSSGWHGSSGSSGGSSGGTYYYAPGEVEVQGADPSTAPPAADDMTPGKTTSIRRADGLLAVSVPEDAKIYVNGAATSSTGADRSYVSRDLQNGMNYSYEVRAEVVREGKTVEQVKTINVRAGETARLAFDFAGAQDVETALTLRVPADAKVYLAGNQTSASGELRVFRTTGLTAGKTWSDYTIRVEFEQDGKTVTQEKTIALVGGQSQELSFPQQVEKIAAR